MKRLFILFLISCISGSSALLAGVNSDKDNSASLTKTKLTIAGQLFLVNDKLVYSEIKGNKRKKKLPGNSQFGFCQTCRVIFIGIYTG